MKKDRLLRRAQLVARLHHPNLARMLPLPGGAGLTPVTSGARRLADFSTSDGAFGELELEQAIWLIIDVLSGLRALHELEVDGAAFVHGSISPQYVLLGEPGTARLVPITSAHLNPSLAVETSGYAAPEALLGDAADLRADLFSVGVLLWEALARRRLFPDGSLGAVMTRLGSDEAPPLRSLVSASWALPLCQIAERAIALAPSERFGSALELSLAIVATVGPRLTSPEPAASSRRPAAPPTLEPTPRAPSFRSATPMSIVIELPPPSATSTVVESEVAPLGFDLPPPANTRWQRCQPVLAGLAGVLLALGVAQLLPRSAPQAGEQPLATSPVPAAATPVPETPSVTTALVRAPLPSTSTAAAAPPARSTVLAPSARRPAPRKAPSKLSSPQHADSDYGI